MMAAKARGKNRIVVYAGDVGERPDVLDAAPRRPLGRPPEDAAERRRAPQPAEQREGHLPRRSSSELRGLIDYHSCRVYLVEGDYVVPVAIKGDGVTEEKQVQALRIELGTGITGHVAEIGPVGAPRRMRSTASSRSRSLARLTWTSR